MGWHRKLLPVSVRSFFQRIGRGLRYFGGYLPDLPRLPSPRKIAETLRNTDIPGVPRAFSREEFIAWWRETRVLGFLPPLPRIPGPRQIAAWHRQKKIEKTAGLFSSVPTASTVAETLKESSGARKMLVWVVLLIVVGTAIYFAGPRTWTKVKSYRARQLAAQALVLIDHEDWPGATKKITSAFQLDRLQPEVWRAYARFLSRNGHGASALEWWAKLEKIRALPLEDLRDYLASAISANEIGVAEQQVARIWAGPEHPAPIDHLLAGQLAVLRGNLPEAMSEASAVMQDSSATRHDLLSADLLVLAASSRDSAPYVKACAQLVEVARGAPDENSLEALVVLAKQASARPPGADGNKSLSIPLPDLSAENMPATEIAERLEQHPRARAYHKMLALEMRARAAPDTEPALIQKALASYGNEDDRTVATLGAWLYARGHFDAVLNLLPIERASRTKELLVERIDALAGLKRFDELKEMLLTEYPVLPQALQHMYLAVVYADLGQTTPSNDEWQRALDTADNVDRLLTLADFAQKNKHPEIVEEALGRATVKQPNLRSAYIRRLRVLEVIGPTEKAHQVAEQIVALWPEDAETRLHEIYLRLLLGSDAALAENEVGQLLRKVPANGVARSTIALARLKAGHPASALQVIGGADINVLPTNVSWPVYTAALAANGWKDRARDQAKRLATTTLLPEERALIAPLLTGDH